MDRKPATALLIAGVIATVISFIPWPDVDYETLPVFHMIALHLGVGAILGALFDVVLRKVPTKYFLFALPVVIITGFYLVYWYLEHMAEPYIFAPSLLLYPLVGLALVPLARAATQSN
ncbi:hypothetical protein KRX51_02010 [Corynebacterium sp. TAE3-ERU12]|uniref:hypothetical protein n=1 Tax=Corynebacterium sp. TAE3-ERU12 TaxID=2849491 RepID=UPI001C46FE96|nr:hypothetical protein [Corynebacterium sp. TAE3-ERU12]MBV7294693.1 hypothetical protein [Corynebacterium sp. TAE3-ERU12]